MTTTAIRDIIKYRFQNPELASRLISFAYDPSDETVSYITSRDIKKIQRVLLDETDDWFSYKLSSLIFSIRAAKQNNITRHQRVTSDDFVPSGYLDLSVV